MDYRDYLKSEHWQNLRKQKLARTRNCGVCGSTSNLDVHHLNYRDLYSVTLSDLRVLCRRCHFLAHDLQKSGALKFTTDNHHSRFILLKMAVKKALDLNRDNLFRGRYTHQREGEG